MSSKKMEQDLVTEQPKVISHDICLSLSDILHSVWQSLGTFISLQIELFHLLWLDNVPLFLCLIFFIHPSLDGYLDWFQFSSVQSLSRVRLFATPWITARQASLSIASTRSLLKLMPMSQWCHPAISSSVVPFCPQSLPASGSFPMSQLCMRWPKYWSFSFSISPSNEHLGLISFKMDWLDLLAVQVTLKSLLQHRSSKAQIFQCSTFFTVQLSHLTLEKP